MTPLEQLIAKNVRRFDLICLVRALAHIGYSVDEIGLRSHFSLSSQASLIEAIEFRTEPRQAIVTLNLGLLGGQSPLPSYMFKLVHTEAVEPQRFVDFMGYFDDRLLRRYLFAVYPEMDRSLFPNWETHKGGELQSLKLDSLSVLHWLARLIFPELQARVEKTTLSHRIEVGAPVLGKTKLGRRAVFGKRLDLPVLGRRISLVSDEENDPAGRPWPQEIERRLESLLFPILRNVGVDLEVWLVIRVQRSWLRLETGSYLGYEGIRGGKAQHRRVRVFSGRLFDWH